MLDVRALLDIRGVIPLNVAFKQVDVFTATRFKGNPVAVVLRGESLTTEQMQQIASWTNLSETTFVLPPTTPDADYRVRIFTPKAELSFAGHPTIGTAHALLEAGHITPNDGVILQECDAGLIRLLVSKAADGTQSISFELPRPKFSALKGDEVLELEAILGSAFSSVSIPHLVDTGPRWVVAQLPTAQAVLKARPDLQRLKAHDAKTGNTGLVIFGPYEAGSPTGIELRAFAPAHGIDEDPVCGSGNGSVGAFIVKSNQTGRFGMKFLSSQGAVVGRSGLIQLDLSKEESVQVGGNAVTCIDGTISL